MHAKNCRLRKVRILTAKSNLGQQGQDSRTSDNKKGRGLKSPRPLIIKNNLGQLSLLRTTQLPER